MPIGPRLDRPSAIGDEGRPRATSLTIVSVVVVAVLVTVGYRNGQPLAFTSAALFVGLTSGGMALLNRDRLGVMVLGHLCFLPSAVVLTIILGDSLLADGSPGLWFLAVGSLLAMFGVATGWHDVLDAETVKGVLVESSIAYVFFWIALVTMAILSAFLWLVRRLLTFLVTGAGPVVGVVGAVGVGAVALSCLYLAVWSVPAVQLTPANRRELASERYALLKRRLLGVAIGSWVALGVAVFVAVIGLLGAVVVPLAPLFELLAPFATVVLTVVSVVSLLLAVAIWGVRWAIPRTGENSTRAVAATIAAVSYLFGLLLAIPTLLRFGVEGVGVFVATPILPMAVYAALLGVLGLFYLGLVSERAGSTALSATGLFAVGLGGALAGYPALFVFGTIAAALVVWDVGTFGLGVTAELGHMPETRRLELYHGVFAVGVGLLGVAVLTLLDATRQTVGGGLGTPVAMGIAVLGVVFLLLPLRG